MPRAPRAEETGAVFHVCARGNERAAIFADDADRRLYLRLLAGTVGRTGWSMLAWCLMPNHVHLVVETPMPNLGAGMRWLHGTYARRFNDRHGRVGHLFQGRYKAIRQRTDEQLWHALRYVADNPVEAGLCADPACFPWSSDRHARRGGRDALLAVDRLAWFLGTRPGDAARAYAALVTPANGYAVPRTVLGGEVAVPCTRNPL